MVYPVAPGVKHIRRDLQLSVEPTDVETSNFAEDTAECGCVNAEAPEVFTGEMVPEAGAVMTQGELQPTVSYTPSTFTVGGITPTSVTFNFGHYPGHMGGPVMVDAPNVMKMDDTEMCHYDEDGFCLDCGY